jgi:hypothetical protein
MDTVTLPEDTTKIPVTPVPKENPIVRALVAIWKFFDGKKTYIACTYWTVLVPSLPALYPAGVPSKINTIFVITGIVLSALGLGHAGVRALIGTPDA